MPHFISQFTGVMYSFCKEILELFAVDFYV